MKRRQRQPAATASAAAAAGAATAGDVGAIPRPPQPAFVDGRVLFVALVVASPAAVRVSQGLLSLDEMLVRYLVIAAGCAVVGTLVRWCWPLIAGETAAPAAAPRADRPAVAAAPAAPAPTEDLFALDTVADLTSLEQLES